MDLTSDKYLDLDTYLKALLGKDGWRLPLNVLDRMYITFLVIKNYFNPRASTGYHLPFSPKINAVIRFLSRKDVIDNFTVSEACVPGFFYCFIKLKNLNQNKPTLIAEGVSSNIDIAISKALGETLERSITGFLDQNNHTVTVNMNLTSRANVYLPSKFHTFTDLQRKNNPNLFPPLEIECFTGCDIVTHQDILIPKNIVRWFEKSSETNGLLISRTTNGVAGFFSKEAAILNAIYEILERDAFLVCWLLRVVPRKFKINTLPETIKKMVSLIELSNHKIHILDTVTNIKVPSVVVVAENNGRLFFSASACSSYEEAIKKSLEELVGVCSRKPLNFFPLEKAMWFISGETINFPSETKNENSSKDKELQICLNILSARGVDYHPIVYFPKNSIQNELNFFIAQVYIEKAFPYYLDPTFATTKSERLREVADFLKIKVPEFQDFSHPLF